MSNALTTSIAALHGDLQRLDTISQNLANGSTTGYRRVVPARSFPAMMTEPQASAAPAHVAEAARVDLSQGPMRATNRAWDMAIAGDGYFEVTTPDGTAYTRAGDFTVDARGQLVNAAGHTVQGVQGPIVLNGPDATIDAQGRIHQNGALVGQIKIIRFGGGPLHKTAGGLLTPEPGTAQQIVAEPALQSGHLEASNVAPMREMVSLLETTRHFESVQKLYQGYDEMIGSAIQKLGQF